MESTDIVICTIAKNETLYIRDFCEYHINLGFDKIYIYEDNDVPEIAHLVDGLPNVIVQPCNYTSNQAQLEVYNDFLKHVMFSWCAFIDVDEYITLQKYETIHEFINSFDTSIDVIRLPEEVFGDGGNIHPDDISVPVYQRILYPASNTGTILCKNIVKYNQRMYMSNPHSVDSFGTYMKCSFPNGQITDANRVIYFRDALDKNYSWIRHYMTKTTEEFCIQKLGRPRILHKNELLSEKYYFHINKRTPEKEEYIRNFIMHQGAGVGI